MNIEKYCIILDPVKALYFPCYLQILGFWENEFGQYKIPFFSVSGNTISFLNNVFELMLKPIPGETGKIVIWMEAWKFNEVSEAIYLRADYQRSWMLDYLLSMDGRSKG